jgi:hypothetical protein
MSCLDDDDDDAPAAGDQMVTALHHTPAFDTCSQLLVVGPGDDVALLKEEVMSDMADIFSSVDKGGACCGAVHCLLCCFGWGATLFPRIICDASAGE